MAKGRVSFLDTTQFWEILESKYDLWQNSQIWCLTYKHSLRMFCIQRNIYARGECFLDTVPIHIFLRIIWIKVWFMAEELNFRYMTYEHSLRMFCIQSRIYGKGEGFVLDIRAINTLLSNFWIKVWFMAEVMVFF